MLTIVIVLMAFLISGNCIVSENNLEQFINWSLCFIQLLIRSLERYSIEELLIILKRQDFKNEGALKSNEACKKSLPINHHTTMKKLLILQPHRKLKNLEEK